MGLGKWGMAILVLALGLMLPRMGLGEESVADRSQSVDELRPVPRKRSNAKRRQQVMQAHGITQEGSSLSGNDKPSASAQPAAPTTVAAAPTTKASAPARHHARTHAKKTSHRHLAKKSAPKRTTVASRKTSRGHKPDELDRLLGL